MRSTPARRELTFVLALAGLGLALVLVVVFAPWYPAGPPASAEVATVRDHITKLVGDEQDGGAAIR